MCPRPPFELPPLPDDAVGGGRPVRLCEVVRVDSLLTPQPTAAVSSSRAHGRGDEDEDESSSVGGPPFFPRVLLLRPEVRALLGLSDRHRTPRRTAGFVAAATAASGLGSGAGGGRLIHVVAASSLRTDSAAAGGSTADHCEAFPVELSDCFSWEHGGGGAQQGGQQQGGASGGGPSGGACVFRISIDETGRLSAMRRAAVALVARLGSGPGAPSAAALADEPSEATEATLDGGRRRGALADAQTQTGGPLLGLGLEEEARGAGPLGRRSSQQPAGAAPRGERWRGWQGLLTCFGVGRGGRRGGLSTLGLKGQRSASCV
ncbi:hypothetical protein HYH03_017762 [Edaphochlamys debaryana]|uniref:Uncharacterized protein n=1 Tax=Edaphochlamys debaryana TaxID=47281 RepID=A0A835XFZ3_9CHLO|nr:hypothetical protein HYH03_017762 [Edaphochlamys debaryana]|eukprot:KAG2483363.1 hypothetical protein HYH03_017762 [Edaphochlamys debaryana]